MPGLGHSNVSSRSVKQIPVRSRLHLLQEILSRIMQYWLPVDSRLHKSHVRTLLRTVVVVVSVGKELIDFVLTHCYEAVDTQGLICVLFD